MKKSTQKPSQIKSVRRAGPLAKGLGKAKAGSQALAGKSDGKSNRKMSTKMGAKLSAKKAVLLPSKANPKSLLKKVAEVMGMSAKPAKKAASKAPAKATKPTPPKKVAKPAKGSTKAVAAPAKAESVKTAKGAKEISKELKAKGAKTSGKESAKEAGAETVALVPGKAAKGAKAAKPGKLGKDIKEKSAAALERASQAGEKLCRESGCENFATTKGYCRLDYIKNWKKIKRKEMILKEGKLNQYIEELVSKYPDKYIDIIRQDLSTEVNFNKIIHDLELDESIDDLEYDGDSIDSLIGAISKSSDDMDDGDF